MNYATFLELGKKKSGKVNHEKVKIGDIEFDSIAESNRYIELRAMEKAGMISQLECHPRYEIIPATQLEGHRKFQAAHYTADFQYMRDGKLVVEDVKSEYTRKAEDYRLRRKLMAYVNGIYVEEVIR